MMFQYGVSILISVDSGLIQKGRYNKKEVYIEFQSLFQWIPVLYGNIPVHSVPWGTSFNPYFSGFRSYTQSFYNSVNATVNVSILISVDSGLIQAGEVMLRQMVQAFQSLFQWIPVLY